jgi:hypothetical protein
MRTTTRNGTALAALACAGVLAGAAEPANVPYPAGYRDWAHVKSMVIEKGHPLFETFGGIHHAAIARGSFPTVRSSCSTCSKPPRAATR